MRYGPEEVERYDLGSLRITAVGRRSLDRGSVAMVLRTRLQEEDSDHQYFRRHRSRRLHLHGHAEPPDEPRLVFACPALGVGADIVDAGGNSLPPGEVGELVLRHSSIGLTKSLWKADARYIESYWSTLPDLWVHGDFAMRGHDGLYYILGRSDDTIKISGKRTGPAELEGILIETGKVSEAAVFGIPHPVKGSAIVCACVPMPGVDVEAGVADQLSSAIVTGMGASYRPERIIFVDDLPRTRNLKIMRRVLRAVFENKDPGDLSALANPEAVERLREKLATT